MWPHRWQPTKAPVPGILQARIMEWDTISFSSAWKWKVKVKSLSHVLLFETPWTVAHPAPPSMGFSRQEYLIGVPLPSLQNSTRDTKRMLLEPRDGALSIKVYLHWVLKNEHKHNTWWKLVVIYAFHTESSLYKTSRCHGLREECPSQEQRCRLRVKIWRALCSKIRSVKNCGKTLKTCDSKCIIQFRTGIAYI